MSFESPKAKVVNDQGDDTKKMNSVKFKAQNTLIKVDETCSSFSSDSSKGKSNSPRVNL